MVKELEKLVRSQSMIKDLERKDGCPYKWYHDWVHNEIPDRASKVMDYGTYFETIVIGGSAHGDSLSELPLLKSGKKSSDNIRIDEQAEYAKQMLFDKNHKDYLGINVTDTQLKVYNKELNFRGIIDIAGNKLDGRAAIVDLKLTGDTETTHGPYPWGDLDRFDFFQMVLYSYLFEKEYKVKPVIYYMVFDFSPKMGKIVVELDVDDNTISGMMDRINSFEEAIEHYSENGFTKYPSLKECEGCPFEKIGCDQHYKIDEVKHYRIKV